MFKMLIPASLLKLSLSVQFADASRVCNFLWPLKRTQSLFSWCICDACQQKERFYLQHKELPQLQQSAPCLLAWLWHKRMSINSKQNVTMYKWMSKCMKNVQQMTIRGALNCDGHRKITIKQKIYWCITSMTMKSMWPPYELWWHDALCLCYTQHGYQHH